MRTEIFTASDGEPAIRVIPSRGRGRPSTGVRVDIRIPPELLAEVDQRAIDHGNTRAEEIRYYLEVGLRHAD